MNGDKFSVNIFQIIILLFLVQFTDQSDVNKDIGKKPEERPESRRLSHLEKSMSEASQEKAEHEERANEQTNQIQILENGDPYTFLLVSNSSQLQCLYVTEDDIPDDQKGLQSFREDCEPDISVPFNASRKCKLYTKSMNDSECLMPTHFLCDPIAKKCVCGNEDTFIADVRFQVGTEFGKDFKIGRCYIRPTFDWLPTFECAPGSSIEPVTAGEDSTPINICKCNWENEYDHEKFDSTDNDWWKCSSFASLFRPVWQLILISGFTTFALSFMINNAVDICISNSLKCVHVIETV